MTQHIDSPMTEVREAMLRERELDHRPIVGIRVSPDFLRALNSDAAAMLPPGHEPGAAIRTCYGLAVNISLDVDRFRFDH